MAELPSKTAKRARVCRLFALRQRRLSVRSNWIASGLLLPMQVGILTAN